MSGMSGRLSKAMSTPVPVPEGEKLLWASDIICWMPAVKGDVKQDSWFLGDRRVGVFDGVRWGRLKRSRADLLDRMDLETLRVIGL